MTIVRYLDVIFNLNDYTYRPYHKPDNIIQYIHVESNHPPNIIKQILKTIEKCLSQLSSNKKILNESAPFYEDKLQRSGYQQKLKYNSVNTKTENKRNHTRNLIWFNPPFSRNIPTKIGKYFLNLRDKHDRLHIIFNRNSVKVSYSCTKNMKTVINNHNYNSRKSYLCPNEKLEIALHEEENLLNKKTELISKCRHQNKFMLLRHDSKDWKWVIYKETIIL